MLIRDVMAERGWDEDEFAAILAQNEITVSRGEKKGETISADDLRQRVSRGQEIPRAWANRLGIELPEGRRSERAPRRPKDAPIVPYVPAEGSRDRIAGLYRMVGGGLGMAVARDRGDRPGQGVAAVFNDQADPIAQCWIKAAETNPWARRFVELVSTGGPMGDLVYAHVYLFLGVIYVLGAPLPNAVFPRYEQFRTIDAEPRRAPGATATEPTPGPVVDASANGAGGGAGVAAESPLGDAAG